MQTITLNIGGMTCGGCVKSVTRILENTEGVAKAEVNLEKKNAVIEFDPAKTNAAALIEAVEDGGYDAAV
ncbi:heavy-metal-associated domain-containing protein [Eikenella sp. S3360]|uniref:Heavy-metal-associated domain-containing protein n=1 Tax=Eikenella glucosivorans TaxID=2766967 RepID=A0ABS0N9I7_9NEIS|nr:heavy-metal-associated domain-containing protein [Eikenella glucosivorans]MBH5328968.1 heavy-metal-associated domain-containing protein [Eikenella glucosivorans]